jgi:hypothetical protein
MKPRMGMRMGLALALTAPAVVGAQGRLEITGSMRGGYWSSTRDLDDRDPLGGGMLWLKARVPLPSGSSAFAEGWGALRGPPERGKAAAELREGYVTTSYKSFDLKLGRQIIAWGRADGVNPTGNLVAEDLTLLTPDDADRRLGSASAVGTFYMGSTSVSGLWLPEFRGHRFPLPADGGATFVDEARRWPGDQWAVRIERTGGTVDWSASFYRGLDLLPDMEPGVTPGQVTLRHRLNSVAGVDAAMNAGRFGLRAEGAYVRTSDRNGTDPFAKNPFLFYVIGGDRTYAGRLNVNLQYIGRVILDFAEPANALAVQQAILSSQTRRVQHGASMRASIKWLHETLETELAGLTYAAPHGVVVRPKVTYALSDRVLLSTGGEAFRGSDASLFRMMRPNSAVYLEARWGF